MAKVTRKGDGLAKIKLASKELGKLNAFVGWLESARYDDQTPVAGVAAVQEFGSPAKGIPPRPFMRVAIEENKREWRALIESGSRAIIAGNETADSVMEKLGLFVVGNIKTAISQVTSPALAQSTINARLRARANKNTVGSLDKPLVDTGTMIATVTHEVRS